ncbi:unnamed protein product [Oppiella nova]|uniref:eIF3a PCI domain-containing protein n=1 Tax=Oppiella nova TaxID=334625 RepID=A0A7R9MFJ3_9ACAR|nr:unnamed protein product [Oppiella nova]CAG2176311.1 unnamed protein product [Oppiella nova]
MPIYFHRLENALKRANEFIDVGKKPRALEILCDVLRSRKHRTWQKKHEDIMIKYLELCVELKKSYVAKEGIYQYKIICQQTYINSFEDVVRKYLEMAEEKAQSAQKESKQSVLDVDDLDNAQTPEDILLSAVSNEDTQDRTDRVVLIPWVKFLWESYRQCLDLLKNNSRTERLYHDVAHQAFKFCIKYNRKTEFRKLCDNLHTHLDILKKQQQQNQAVGHQQQNAINLNSPEKFIDVGKKPRALEILCDVLRSRKHRTWQKKHEDIMIKYLELCVELKKSYVAKEGIYQYKIICQQTYINSFEDVVRKYLEMAEEKAQSAQKESKQSVLDVDDLDNAQTPEDILLSAVSNEDTQDRTDRVVLIPWVKFLWESYRQYVPPPPTLDPNTAGGSAGAAPAGTSIPQEDALLEKALAMSLEADEDRGTGVKPPMVDPSAMPDFATMTEEEQIAYAMQMSLQHAHDSSAKPVDSPVPMETDDTEDKTENKDK